MTNIISIHMNEMKDFLKSNDVTEVNFVSLFNHDYKNNYR